MQRNPLDRIDIQQMLGLTWKPGKILLGTGNLIIAYFVILFFNWLAPSSPQGAWFARILVFIGDLLAYFIILAGMTRVARFTLKELGVKSKENGGKEILKAPIKIFAVIAGLAVIHIIIDLLGKIPYLGELFWMFSPLLNIPIALGIVFASLALIFGIMLLPTIISLGEEGPVSILIDFVRKHTLRFLGHFLIALGAATVIIALTGAIFHTTYTLSAEFMGEKFGMIFSNIPGWTQTYSVPELPYFWMPAGFGSLNPEAGRWTMVVAGFVFGVITWGIKMAVMGVVMVNFCVAGTISYLVLEGLPSSPDQSPDSADKPTSSPPKKKKRAPRKKSVSSPKKPPKKTNKPEELQEIKEVTENESPKNQRVEPPSAETS